MLYAQVLQDYFKSVLSLAQVFLRSPEPVISHVAAAIYKQSFVAFDTFSRQVAIAEAFDFGTVTTPHK